MLCLFLRLKLHKLFWLNKRHIKSHLIHFLILNWWCLLNLLVGNLVNLCIIHWLLICLLSISIRLLIRIFRHAHFLILFVMLLFMLFLGFFNWLYLFLFFNFFFLCFLKFWFIFIIRKAIPPTWSWFFLINLAQRLSLLNLLHLSQRSCFRDHRSRLCALHWKLIVHRHLTILNDWLSLRVLLVLLRLSIISLGRVLVESWLMINRLLIH